MSHHPQKNLKRLVRDGYDKVSEVYRKDQVDGEDETAAGYREWIGELSPLIPPGSPVLDLGCGNGIPECRLLVDAGFVVTGVDISPVQIKRAEQLVPQGRFVCADMTSLDFPPASFCAVISLYAFIHLPLNEQPEMFAKIHTWLKPGGYLLVIVGAEAWTGVEKDWLGVAGADMYWSHADKGTYIHWLMDKGYRVLWSRFIPEGAGGHELIFAQTPL